VQSGSRVLGGDFNGFRVVGEELCGTVDGVGADAGEDVAGDEDREGRTCHFAQIGLDTLSRFGRMIVEQRGRSLSGKALKGSLVTHQ